METNLQHTVTVASLVINFFSAVCIPVFLYMINRLWKAITELSKEMKLMRDERISMKDVDLAIAEHRLDCRQKRSTDISGEVSERRKH